MQRILTFLLTFFAVSLTACAAISEKPAKAGTPPVASARPAAQPEVTLSPLTRVPPPVASGEALQPRQHVGALPVANKNAHVALLLPLNSPVFGRAAEMVRQGFMAAAAVQAGDLPVKIYSGGDQTDDIVSAYGQAVQAGARIVVGPLTKNGVTALAASQQVSVPTLALNLPETGTAWPPRLYLLSLAADAEARQIAQSAYGEGHRSAVIIASGNALARRMQQAFAAEWALLGGTIVAQLGFNSNNADVVRDALRKSPSNLLFFALDGQEARLLRPYIDPEWPVYATSQIYAGKHLPQKYHDLNGVRFIDMPWLIQPDHLAVMAYPSPSTPLPADMERLYALGIDAWRLGLLLQNAHEGETLDLDGVTGQLRLGPTGQILREGVAATFRDGEAVSLMP